jgi:hypothetical protein
MSRTALALRLGAAALCGLVTALLFAVYATPAMTLALDALALCF